MAAMQSVLLLALVYIASAQRPSFAGSRPIGFPELLNKTTTPSGLEDKFGEGTTQRLPIEAQGDRELIDRLSKLPIDKQPFWFINWQALEAQREKPQTYPQRPNPFVEANFQSSNPAPQIQNTNTGILNPTTGNQPPNFKVQIPIQTTDPVNNDNGNSNVGNRFNPVTSTGSASVNPDTNILKPSQNPDPKVPSLPDDPVNGNYGGGITTATDNDNNNPRPVKPNNIKPESPHPESVIAGNKKVEVIKAASHDESEFEDIQVKKIVNSQ